MSALDSLVFLPAALQSYQSATHGKSSTSLAFGARGGSRKALLQLPFVVRALGTHRLGPRWNVFCDLLREHGIAITSSSSALESLPAKSVPVRFGRRSIDEPLDAQELATADVFELDCRRKESHAWSWPGEADTDARLGAFVESIRVATAEDTPIGVALPIGAHSQDLVRCLAAGVDFLTLVADNQSGLDHLAMRGISNARDTCIAQGQDNLPIVIDAPLLHARQLLICLALGASAVGIDGVLSPLIKELAQQSASIGAGMLKGIAVAPPPDMLEGVAEMLTRLRTELENQMLLSGVCEVSKLDRSCLRAVSQDVGRMCGVQVLE